ncbi:AbrB family transcriptional regulator [Thioclava sp. BHET1]|nr:AbrB family transcriptional regulator [Thioclava sp. BHET1]
MAGHGPETLGLGASLLLLVLGVLAALGFARLRLPAAALLAGLVVSALAHATGLIAGRPAPELTFAGFATAGAVVGSRFAGIRWADLRQLGLASLASTGIGLAVAAAAAFLVATLLDRSFGEVMVAFAPGGVEAMASMALSLGYDPVFVSTHHIFRILILFLLLPLLLRRLGSGRAAG